MQRGARSVNSDTNTELKGVISIISFYGCMLGVNDCTSQITDLNTFKLRLKNQGRKCSSVKEVKGRQQW
jgi:hypothetical protein